MSENRRQILEMLSQGKINAEEAGDLAALEREPASSDRPGAAPQRRQISARRRETSTITRTDQVNVRVPIQLLRAGVKLTKPFRRARVRVNGLCARKASTSTSAS